jgi:biotin transport system substrate-specific component
MSTMSTMATGWGRQEVIASRGARRTIGLAAFVIATALSAYVVVPLPVTPVPVTLQPLVVLLAGLVLGPWLGASAMVAYLGVGMSGVPVFAGGGAGLPWLLGPTGGYLMAFPAAAFLAGRLAGGAGAHWARIVVACLAGLAALYLGGVSQLLVVTGQDLSTAVTMGVIPFLLGDVLKVAVATVIATRIRDRGLQLF